MVNDFQALLPILRKNKKISFFALLRMDDLTDRWSIVISGYNLKKIENRKRLFGETVRLLSKHSDLLKKQNVARIGIFPLQSHLVRELIRYDEKIENEKANGNFIHEGYILINQSKNKNLTLL